MPIHAEFQYTIDDIREASAAVRAGGRKIHLGRGVIGWLLFVVLAIVLVKFAQRSPHALPTTAAAVPQDEGNWWSDYLLPFLPWVIIFGFIWFGVFRTTRGAVRRAWQNTPAYHRPWAVQADERGFMISEPLARLQYEWAAFPRYVETTNLFVIMLETKTAHVIPKRAFDAASVAEFRDLLQHMIGQRAGAFPVIQAGVTAGSEQNSPPRT